MLDDIAAIQQRISDIQSRIATLNGALTPPPPDTTGTDSAGRSFDNVLANERARYGAAISPTDQTDAATPEPAPSYPTGLPGTAIPLGRRPYVPPASAGPLPSSTPATSGSLPLVPSNQEIVPIKTGGLSEYEPLIDRYAAANGLSPKLVRAVIKTESDGNPRDVSRAGAMGLMQLMPDNVREAGISDPFDPEQNIAAGTKQLADLMKQYGGDLDLTLAGYNAGPGNVRKYGGVPPFHETQNYIRKVRRAMGEE